MFLPAFPAILTPMLCFGAEIIWLDRHHDLGRIQDGGGKQTAISRFVNPGPDTLAIMDARTRCDCTYVEYPDREILPGDTVAVRMVYDPEGKRGSVSQSVRLVFSDSSTALIRLTGTVEASSSNQ